MLYKKLFTFFLCLVFVGQTLAQTASKTDVKKSDVAPALQEKAVALLKSLARDAEQFSLPLNRVAARIEIAGLLWESDEKQSRNIFQSAISELNTMINQVPPANLENEEENAERYIILSDVKTLRNDLLVALASRDPKFALETLQALSRKDEFGKSIFEDDQTLELNLAAQIAEKDPKQAYELAKKNLENGLNYNLFSTLEDLYKKDAELGAKLAHDIAGKIKSKDAKVISYGDYLGNSMNSRMTNSNVTNGTMSGGANQVTSYDINASEIQSFLDTVKKLNRQAARNKKSAV